MSASPPTGMLSIVIPVFNESESLGLLHSELTRVAKDNGYAFQMIFVDDGSTDDSWKQIQALAQHDPRVEGIRFRRNFGKAAALSAAFRAVRGPICLTLDADLQDDPNEIPRFLAEIGRGYDVVSGWKKIRHDPWHKVIPSRLFNSMVSRWTGVRLHDHNCGMKCYRAEVLQEVRLYGELHRFIPVLAAARGFKIGELIIQHRARKFGKSKYGVKRFVKGFLDLMTVKFLTSFSRRPQHVLGSFGLVSFGLGCLGLTYLAITWLIRYFNPDAPFDPLHTRPLMTYSLGGVLLGAQLLSMGILAEMLTAYQSREEETYSIAERIAGTNAGHTTTGTTHDG